MGASFSSVRVFRLNVGAVGLCATLYQEDAKIARKADSSPYSKSSRRDPFLLRQAADALEDPADLAVVEAQLGGDLLVAVSLHTHLENGAFVRLQLAHEVFQLVEKGHLGLRRRIAVEQ